MSTDLSSHTQAVQLNPITTFVVIFYSLALFGYFFYFLWNNINWKKYHYKKTWGTIYFILGLALTSFIWFACLPILVCILTFSTLGIGVMTAIGVFLCNLFFSLYDRMINLF